MPAAVPAVTPPDSERRRFARTLAGLPLLVPLLALRPGEAEAAPAPPMPKLGDRLALPERLPLLDGGEFTAAQGEGRVVVVYWWASWCPFCALQTPEMQKLWEQHRAQGLVVLGISIDSRVEDARKYMRERKYTFPSGFASPEVARALPKPGKGLPVTCVRGRDGRIVMAESGQLFPEDIAQIARFL